MEKSYVSSTSREGKVKDNNFFHFQSEKSWNIRAPQLDTY